MTICERCGEPICPHGWCDCYDDPCPQCEERKQKEWDAEREVRYQKNVIGPMFGWDKENDDDDRTDAQMHQAHPDR